MSHTLPDPVRRTAELISPDCVEVLEQRLKRDIFASIGRVKPTVIDGVDFDTQVMQGDFFAGLIPPLQGIAIARCEGALAFYQRVGFSLAFLDTPLQACVPEAGLAPLSERYHARTLHDLAYVHPRHFEKILGKAEAASLWETLKRFAHSA